MGTKDSLERSIRLCWVSASNRTLYCHVRHHCIMNACSWSRYTASSFHVYRVAGHCPPGFGWASLSFIEFLSLLFTGAREAITQRVDGL